MDIDADLWLPAAFGAGLISLIIVGGIIWRKIIKILKAGGGNQLKKNSKETDTGWKKISRKGN